MRPHVMIVDDAAYQLRLMRNVFQMVDPAVQVVTASSGDEALSTLRSAPRNLPKVSRRVIALSPLATPPVVAGAAFGR